MTYSPKPFPKPIQTAVELLADQTIARWLEWQPCTPRSSQIALVLVSLGERKNRTKRLWCTWEKYVASVMQESLRQIGITVLNGDAFELPPPSKSMIIWTMPPTDRPLIEVFDGDRP